MSEGDVTQQWAPYLLSDENKKKRDRYVKDNVKRGNTELIQCRADAFQVRRIDEIVAARIEVTFKTRSDVVQDAIAMWLEDWDSRYPDGASGELGYQSRIEAMKRKRRLRTDFIESAEDELSGLQSDGDLRGLTTLLQTLLMAQADFRDDAPVTYMVKLDNMIHRTERLINASTTL